MTAKIPVHIITGFLGAGKTTAIIQLLKSKPTHEKWAVIINEFGMVSIDFEMLAPLSSSNEKVFEISGGCICCSAKNYFFDSLKSIVTENHFQRIIIEPSGLGGIEYISEQLDRFDHLELQPVICLTAVDFIDRPRIERNMIYQSQLKSADILALSKCDLLNDSFDEKKMLDLFKQKYPGKADYLLLNKQKSLLDFITCPAKTTCQRTEHPFYFLPEEVSSLSYLQHTFEWDKKLLFDINKLKKTLLENPSILRAKGFILTKEGEFRIDLSGGRFSKYKDLNSQKNILVFIIEKKDVENIAGFQRKIESCFTTQTFESEPA